MYAEIGVKRERGSVRGISLYQPADFNVVVGGGGGSYEMPGTVNDTAHLGSVNTALNSIEANFTAVSSAMSNSCKNRFVIVFVISFTLVNFLRIFDQRTS